MRSIDEIREAYDDFLIEEEGLKIEKYNTGLESENDKTITLPGFIQTGQIYFCKFYQKDLPKTFEKSCKKMRAQLEDSQ